MVRDSIVQTFHVAPALGPTVQAGVGTVLNRRHELLVTATWSRAEIERHAGDSVIPVIGVTQWRLTVDLRRQMASWLAARGSIGALRYVPEVEGRAATMFREGPVTFAVVGAGAEVGVPVRAGLEAFLAIRYDLHRFSTLALSEDGFGGARTVHRLSAGLALRASRGR